MTYTIAEPCVDVMDQACVSVCPVDCIHFEEGVDRTLYIDPDECIDCGACEPECPVAAIFPADSVPAEWDAYTEVNALWFADRDAARAKINQLKPPA
jgi:NAD-dependent dihydropyrimidine dehydrogenase PreA subunit